jgi:hypothetical protein
MTEKYEPDPRDTPPSNHLCALFLARPPKWGGNRANGLNTEEKYDD